MKAIETHVFRDGSPSHTTKWTKTDLFCPHCGEKEVWEDDCDDYYDGTGFLCGACGGGLRHPTVHVPKYEADRLARLQAVFKEAK